MTSGLHADLATAVRLHQSGQLDEAERRYRRHLREHRKDAEALYLLGALRLQKGDAREGMAQLRRAIAVVPSTPHFLETLASGGETLGLFEAALTHATHAFAIGASPGSRLLRARLLFQLRRYGEAHAAFADAARLGVGGPAVGLDVALCLRRLGRWPEAEAVYRSLMTTADTVVEALVGLADAAEESGRPGDAVGPLRRAVAAMPGHLGARLKQAGVMLKIGGTIPAAAIASSVLAVLPKETEADPLRIAALSLLGAAYREQARYKEAAGTTRRILALAPGDPDGWANVADVAGKLSGPETGIVFAGRALVLMPDHVGGLINRALALVDLERGSEALTCLRRALALGPGNPSAWSDLDGPLRARGDWSALDTALRRAVAIDPGLATAWYMMATAALTLGDLGRAWPLYRWRFGSPKIQQRRPFDLPWWDGSPPGGRLLAWGEQGVGDEMLHAGLFPDLIERGVNTIVECDRRLVPIFERSFPDLAFVARRDPPDPRLAAPDITAQIALGDLPFHFRPDLASFGRQRSFLLPHIGRLAACREWLESLGSGPKVGIAWRSSRRDPTARRLHTELTQWGPILAVAGVHFVNLQYGECQDEIADAEARFGVAIHRCPGLDLFSDLEGVLALSSGLDLIVSTITTAYILGAAAGTPTWMLLPELDYGALGQPRYPWLPSTRGFVRRIGADWSGPIEAVARALAETAAGTSSGPLPA